LVELKVGGTVSFPQETFERVKGVEGRLYDKHNISFDTGVGSHGVDWELDWSLQHPETISREEAMKIIIDELKLEGLHFKYTVRTYEDLED